MNYSELKTHQYITIPVRFGGSRRYTYTTPQSSLFNGATQFGGPDEIRAKMAGIAASARWGYVRIITGTILGGVLGFYVMHRVEINYKVVFFFSCSNYSIRLL